MAITDYEWIRVLVENINLLIKVLFLPKRRYIYTVDVKPTPSTFYVDHPITISTASYDG